MQAPIMHMEIADWLMIVALVGMFSFMAGYALGQLVSERDRLKRMLNAKKNEILGDWIEEKAHGQEKK
jgi:hypothetical protein